MDESLRVLEIFSMPLISRTIDLILSLDVNVVIEREEDPKSSEAT